MALKFDGSNDDVQVSLDLSSYTDTLNLAFWFKLVTMPTSGVDMVMEISPSANAAGEFNIHLEGTADEIRFAFVAGGPSFNRHDFTKPTVGSWVHIGINVDLTTAAAADRMGIYYDGVKQTPITAGGASGSTTWDNDTLNIASRNSANLRADIEMQDLAFWSGVLDPLLFLEMTKGRSPLGCSPSTLIRYWPMYGTGDPERLGNAGLTIVGATAVEGPLTTQPISAIYPSTVVAAAVGAYMPQLQQSNLGADLYNGTIQ